MFYENSQKKQLPSSLLIETQMWLLLSNLKCQNDFDTDINCLILEIVEYSVSLKVYLANMSKTCPRFTKDNFVRKFRSSFAEVFYKIVV